MTHFRSTSAWTGSLAALATLLGVQACDAQGPDASAPEDEDALVFETEQETVRVTTVADGLAFPWSLVFLPNGDMLVTERPGRLRVIRDGRLDPEPIEGLPAINSEGLGGLFDVALHPEFAENRLVYFAYAKANADEPRLSTTAVARARWDGGSALEDVEDVFVARAWYSQDFANHIPRCCGQGPAFGSHGGRIIFDDDGYLYLTIGERNWGERAQDTDTHLGKIVRLNDDGSVPEDNPFVGDDAYLPEIYTLGNRNPLGLTIHPETRELWSTEFGPRGGDELNLIKAGANYGWILVTEGEYYNGEPVLLAKNSVEGMEDPVAFWGPPSINPGNLLFYTGDAFPAWRSDMLMATMSGGLLVASFDDTGAIDQQERTLTELGQRLRDVRQGPDGLVYLLTDTPEGAVLRLEPAD